MRIGEQAATLLLALEQLLLNLVTNAGRWAESSIRIDASKQGKWVRLRVCDDGTSWLGLGRPRRPAGGETGRRARGENITTPRSGATGLRAPAPGRPGRS